MSRIGEKPIHLPAGVTVNLDGQDLTVKGPKGELSHTILKAISVELADQTITLKRHGQDRFAKAAHGLTNRLIQNLITGVTNGYTKKLELVGTGYRAKPQGQGLVISAGFSHPVVYTPPAGVVLACETETLIVVSGIDKQKVGQSAAEIRAIRPPEPYKGKGIRYQGEIIRRKAGKATKVGASA